VNVTTGEARQITAYSAGKVATVDPAFTVAPAVGGGDQYWIAPLGIDAATITQIQAGVWNAQRDTYQLAGSFGQYVRADTERVSGSAAAADGLEAAVSGATPLPANVTKWLGSAVAPVTVNGVPEVDVTHVGGSAQNIATASALSTMQGNVTDILTDTGTTIPALIGTPTADLATDIAGIDTAVGALNDLSVSDILTTAMTESYAAQGVAPTLAQALFGLYQQTQEAVRVGTTVTVNKLDQTTPAFTMTLDSGSNPSDVSRAT
jgi:hypothetical protein